MNYLKNHFLAGLKTSPRHQWKLSLSCFAVFALVALGLGQGSGLLQWRVADPKLFLFLPVTLFVFPSFLEEAFFRGVLLPQNTLRQGYKVIALRSLLSALLFTAWHPLNALTINPTAQKVFLDMTFLSITFLLGVVCSLGYIFSRSLWVPILMHWATVLAWVLFLGGRNLILE